MYIKNIKRFMLIFETWSERSFHQEKQEFDTEKECKEYAKLIDEVYDNTEITFDRFGNPKEWGYVMLDFQKEAILGWNKKGKIHRCSKNTNKLELKDIFFRKDDEIPKNYKWDDGEYRGWLQYRWGDGKNAIDYRKPKTLDRSENDALPIEKEVDENEEMQNNFDNEIIKEQPKRKFERW